jgi:hypothetical protein
MAMEKMIQGNRTWVTLVTLAVFLFLLMALTGCEAQVPSQEPPVTKEPVQIVKADPPAEGATLYLAQAQFIKETIPDSDETKIVPGPARLVVWTYQAEGWIEEVIEDPDSNVFHKAAWFTPVQGEPGILTIGAQQAHLKLWRKNTNGEWEHESLWNPSFGGTFDRLRDFETADVTRDGREDICIATHDQGVVAIAQWRDDRYVVEELTRKTQTFVHEMEVGDVTGNGYKELFTTPSMPNKMDGSIQPGEVDMYAFDGETWRKTVVDILETRHAKEILVGSLSDEERPVLFASLEGEHIGGDKTGDTTRIRMYRFVDNDFVTTDVASLPGELCRFLTIGDTDGNGKRELIAATSRDGIWRLDPPLQEGESWKKTLIATGTSGFEHATYLSDLNNDGIDEIYVASDNQHQLRRYTWNGRGYDVEVIGKLKNDTITWNITSRKP